MGYEVERAFGLCISVRPKHIVINVDKLLEVDGSKRKKWLKDQADSDLTGTSALGLKSASTADEVVAALGRRVSPRSLDVVGTPQLMAPGSLFLQPGEERRRTGSHYTPRELTEPIVRTTLSPILKALGDRPTPEMILNLKVCDPAMGSGAFLVETCRQLSECLVKAWEVHDVMPQIPPDEEPLLYARRLVAQQCLYGVDKNPFAVNLAKLSIWLVTLAKDHAFTFVDHSLKHGDSLVGLTRKQIAAFSWKLQVGGQGDWIDDKMEQDLKEALGWRNTLQGLDEGDYNQKKEAWWEAENALSDARLIGDLAVAAFFNVDKDKAREELRNQYRSKVEAWRAKEANRHDLEGIVEELRGGEKPVLPMHWEIEFPEVFGRENPGFDAMVGNPPFLGGTRISMRISKKYMNYLASVNENSGNRMDLVAYFFRRSFELLREGAAFGLVATNTIAQGDTRSGGLAWIHNNGGRTYFARRRFRWPGLAAVIVSVVHVSKGAVGGSPILDGRPVEKITAYLFHMGNDRDPASLSTNAPYSFSGVYPHGAGFQFDDKNDDATPVSEMNRLIAEHPGYSSVIHQYIGGKEILEDPRHLHRRYVINFGDMSLEDAEGWPHLLSIVREKVKPKREAKGGDIAAWPWWRFWRSRREMIEALAPLSRYLVHPYTSSHLAFAFLPSKTLLAAPHLAFTFESSAAFGLLQSRSHEVWARFFSSTLKDDLSYSPSDCFLTFPFPRNWQTAPTLEAAGKTYYEFRAELMVRNDAGLTKTYNRFHDPDNREPDIVKLRELHAALDRVVLDAYGWEDISTGCEFLLDYEIDEETWGKKKKPYRYRWPEDVHDEVLARLLDLNQKRYQEEVVAGLHDKKSGKKASKKKVTRKTSPASTNLTLPLYGDAMKSPEEN